MTFFEKIMEVAERNGIANVNQLSNVSGIPYNALRQCKEKNKPLSDNHKRMLAKALKCSVGDINHKMSEARAEELKKDWPDKATCSPSKPAAEPEPAPAPEPAPKPEPVPVPEPEPVAEVEPEPEQATEQPTEDQILEEKIKEIKGKADVLLTYHDRIKNAAKATLAAEYAAMLRSRMLDVAMADLYDLCREFMDGPNPNKAAAIGEVAGEIMKLKEEE